MFKRLGEAVEKHPFLIIGASLIVLLLILGGLILALMSSVNSGTVAGEVEENNSGEIIEINDEPKNLTLYFYDFETGCALDGDVYFSDYLAGKSVEGITIINGRDYYSKVFDGVTVSLQGQTGSCFGENSNLPFQANWQINSNSYYINSEKILDFEAKINPRKPIYPATRKGFIRSEEIQDTYANINFNVDDSVRQDVDRIYSASKIDWISDSRQFSDEDYWQTPLELIENDAGDCEDWTVYFMSLLQEYDEDLNCNAMVWPTHMNVLCHIEEAFIMYDQEKRISRLTLSGDDGEGEILDFKQDLIDFYGFSEEEQKLISIFNWQGGRDFGEGEGFVSWILEQSN